MSKELIAAVGATLIDCEAYSCVKRVNKPSCVGSVPVTLVDAMKLRWVVRLLGVLRWCRAHSLVSAVKATIDFEIVPATLRDSIDLGERIDVKPAIHQRKKKKLTSPSQNRNRTTRRLHRFSNIHYHHSGARTTCNLCDITRGEDQQGKNRRTRTQVIEETIQFNCLRGRYCWC